MNTQANIKWERNIPNIFTPSFLTTRIPSSPYAPIPYTFLSLYLLYSSVYH